MKRSNGLPVSVFRSKLWTAISTNYNGPFGWKHFWLCWCRWGDGRVSAPDRKFWTVRRTSFICVAPVKVATWRVFHAVEPAIDSRDRVLRQIKKAVDEGVKHCRLYGSVDLGVSDYDVASVNRKFRTGPVDESHESLAFRVCGLGTYLFVLPYRIMKVWWVWKQDLCVVRKRYSPFRIRADYFGDIIKTSSFPDFRKEDHRNVIVEWIISQTGSGKSVKGVSGLVSQSPGGAGPRSRIPIIVGAISKVYLLKLRGSSFI